METIIRERVETLQEKTYSKTLVAILISAVVSLLPTVFTPFRNLFMSYQTFINEHILLSALLIIGSLVFLTNRMHKAKTKKESLIWFIALPAFLGFTSSGIFFIYSSSSIVSVFLLTSIYFLMLVLFSKFTKVDFTKYTGVLFISLVTIIIVSVIGLFLALPFLQLILSIASIIVFSFYTIHDHQELVAYAKKGDLDKDGFSKVSYMFAISLYLDFINLFLNLLRIFGRN